MRASSWSAAVSLCALLGCAAGDVGSQGRGSKSPGPSSGNTAGSGPGASAGSGAAAPTGGFGNPGASAPTTRTEPMRPACEAGKFCGPQGADQGCGSLTLEAKVEKIEKPGNVLLVFD